MAATAVNLMVETPAPGVVLCSKYRLIEQLGAGGMGTVWLARNEAIGKDVAVKLLHPDVRGADAAERFLREARAGASVDHPAIVRVFDYGKTDAGQPFIVMERLEGECFSDVIDRNRSLSAIEAVRAVLPIIDGLAAAHVQGIVHRDLKPENLFLAVQGGQLQPKVLDFGVAKVQERDSDLHLTRHGTVVGSPYYMAPEQARGQSDVDHRCDIWAICVIIYEAASGTLPFDGENYNAAMAAIIEREVEPLLEIPGEEGLWDVLAVGLRKDREERFGSMRELGEALARYLVRHGVHDDIRGVPLSASWLSTEGAGRRATPHETLASMGRIGRSAPAHTPTPRKRSFPSWASTCVAAAVSLGAVGYHFSQKDDTDRLEPAVAAAGTGLRPSSNLDAIRAPDEASTVTLPVFGPPPPRETQEAPAADVRETKAKPVSRPSSVASSRPATRATSKTDPGIFVGHPDLKDPY